jgi:hypothetical protein
MLITILGVGAAFLACATLACAAFRTQADRDMVRSLRGEPCEFQEPEELCRGSFVYEPEAAHFDMRGNFHRHAAVYDEMTGNVSYRGITLPTVPSPKP